MLLRKLPNKNGITFAPSHHEGFKSIKDD